MAMTDAERQRKRREELRQRDLKPILVRGKDGEYDERIRVALAVKALADGGEIPNHILIRIINAASEVFPDADNVKKRYIKKLVSDYLSFKGS